MNAARHFRTASLAWVSEEVGPDDGFNTLLDGIRTEAKSLAHTIDRDVKVDVQIDLRGKEYPRVTFRSESMYSLQLVLAEYTEKFFGDGGLFEGDEDERQNLDDAIKEVSL